MFLLEKKRAIPELKDNLTVENPYWVERYIFESLEAALKKSSKDKDQFRVYDLGENFTLCGGDENF